jgi:hypothetical protein
VRHANMKEHAMDGAHNIAGGSKSAFPHGERATQCFGRS